MLTALDVLGYERPTKLRGERARLVGLVLPELQNPIFPAFAEVVGGALAQRGFTPVLCTRTAGGVSEADYVDMLLDQHVSGVIFAGGDFAQADAPTTSTTSGCSTADCRWCWSTPRSTTSASRASSTDDARRGRAGLRAPGLARPRADRPGPRPARPRAVARASWRRSARSSRRPRPRAPASWSSTRCSRSRAARPRRTGCSGAGVTGHHLRQRRRWRSARSGPSAGAGLRVPDDVSVVGYDDSAFMNCTDPPLTTVRQPIEAMGQAAVALLVSEIAGNAGDPPDELLFEPELVVRGSTAPPAATRRSRRPTPAGRPHRAPDPPPPPTAVASA